MILAHKIRLNPTPEQETYFRKAAGVARFTFNWGLAEWQRQYEAGGKPAAHSLKAQFNSLKRQEFPWVLEVTKCATEQAFADLGTAFVNFFRRVKSGEKGYPKFKSKKRATPSFYLSNDKFSTEGNWLKVPKLGFVNMAEPLRLEGKMVSARINQKGNKWFASIQVEVAVAESYWNENPPVGIDLGIKMLLTLSDGVVAENQRHTLKHQGRLRRLNKKLSRQVKGSQNWWKTIYKLRTLNATIRSQRSDYLHKWTTYIASNYGVIGLEDLNVEGMLQNGKLAKHIADASFGEIERQLVYKAKLYGSKVVQVGRWFASSRTCSYCGWHNPNLTLADRKFICQGCGLVLDRDLNAARNIKKEALRLCPETVAGYGYFGVTPVDTLALAGG